MKNLNKSVYAADCSSQQHWPTWIMVFGRTAERGRGSYKFCCYLYIIINYYTVQWGYSPGLTPSPGVWAPQNLKWQRFFLTVHKRKLCRNRKVFVRHGKIMFKNTKSKVQDFPIRKVVIRKYSTWENLCSKITNQKFSFSLSQKSLWDHSGAEPKSRDFYARALYRGWFTAEMLVISRS